jgi:hypothetical protein
VASNESVMFLRMKAMEGNGRSRISGLILSNELSKLVTECCIHHHITQICSQSNSCGLASREMWVVSMMLIRICLWLKRD